MVSKERLNAFIEPYYIDKDIMHNMWHIELVRRQMKKIVNLGKYKIDEEKQWTLVGMKFPDGNSELVLKNNPNLNFIEAEIVVEDVREAYKRLKLNIEVQWIRTPFPNSLGGHVAVMQAPDGNVFVLVGK